jgi:hypothetical protein
MPPENPRDPDCAGAGCRSVEAKRLQTFLQGPRYLGGIESSLRPNLQMRGVSKILTGAGKKGHDHNSNSSLAENNGQIGQPLPSK